MWKVVLPFIAAIFMLGIINSPTAKADYFNYPCQPPGVGTGVQVHVFVDFSGQFCDGPTEINLTHYHCEGGGGGVGGGALALAPVGPLSLGGFGGGGFGGGGNGCSWRCPDNTLAPAPNPPGVGQKEYIDVRAVIRFNKAFCVKEGHLTAAGPTSELVNPDEGFPPTKDLQPYQQSDPNVLVPHAPAPTDRHVPKPQEPEGNIPVPEVPNLPVPVIPPVIPLPGG
jgi:hypothetical protein